MLVWTPVLLNAADGGGRWRVCWGWEGDGEGGVQEGEQEQRYKIHETQDFLTNLPLKQGCWTKVFQHWKARLCPESVSPDLQTPFLTFIWWENAPRSSRASAVPELETRSPIPVFSLASSQLHGIQRQVPNTYQSCLSVWGKQSPCTVPQPNPAHRRTSPLGCAQLFQDSHVHRPWGYPNQTQVCFQMKNNSRNKFQLTIIWHHLRKRVSQILGREKKKKSHT